MSRLSGSARLCAVLAALASFRYDGHGRRTKTTKANGDQRFQIYTQDGQFIWEGDFRSSEGLETQINYIYLNGSLLAKQFVEATLAQSAQGGDGGGLSGSSDDGGGTDGGGNDTVNYTNPFRNLYATTAAVTEVVAGSEADLSRSNAVNAVTRKTHFVHTDALGSPVVETSTTGRPIPGTRTIYEPYGKPLTPPREGAPSYTGHQFDTSTGLLYMQQRYMDPALGRFLSTDPMAVDASSAFNFNRYNYGANSPYKFVDPDGRQGKVAWLVKIGTNELRKVARVTHEQAVRLRKAGENIWADRRQVAHQIETAANGPEGQLKHAGHELPGGSKGLPHYQTEGKYGHTFWSSLSVVALVTADVLDTAAQAADLVDPVSSMTHIADAGLPDVVHECATGCGPYHGQQQEPEPNEEPSKPEPDKEQPE